ncbi:MAG: hypothetical protein ABIZ34_10385 [Candidatus Limnocylindrales bacterium]
MPTFERTARFDRDWAGLDPDDQARFRVVVRRFVADLGSGRFRPGLRVTGVQGAPGIFEMTWASDGRATFQFGPKVGSVPHVTWRRIGTHSVLGEP